jgi:hypothetical protein
LAAAGAQSYVVVPRTLADGRQQKNDGLDASALTDALDQYQRGNTKAFSAGARARARKRAATRPVATARPAQKNLRQWEARGRSLLLAQGHHTTGKWWSPTCWKNCAARSRNG